MRISIKSLTTFADDLLIAAGVDPNDSIRLSRILVWADSVGRTEQGLQRLPILVERMQKGLIQSPAAMTWKEHGSTCHLDAANGFGHVATDQAVDRAIQLANKNAIALVTVSESNYFGAAGYYAARIASSGMIGLIFSNSYPKVCPPGANKPVLGTNPLAFAAPLSSGEPLLIDFATSALAGSDVRRRIEAGQKIDGAALQPFGGYKGFALGILVEVMAGALAGAAIGDEIGSLYTDHGNGGRNGHAILAFKPPPYLDLAERMQQLTTIINESGARLPGSERWRILKESNNVGVEMDERILKPLYQLAKRLQVDLPSKF